MTCNCIETVNEKLKERNTYLVEPWFIQSDKSRRLFVETGQLEKGRGKGKAVRIFTSYCPFCGVKQAQEQVAEQA